MEDNYPETDAQDSDNNNASNVADTDSNNAESASTKSDETEGLKLPDDALIIIPMRNLVLFPQMVIPITIGRESSIRAAQDAARHGQKIGVLLQRESQVESPEPSQMHAIGTVASILRYVTSPERSHHLIRDRKSVV